MTLDEAQKIAGIIATADGGCSLCAGDLAEQMTEAFPGFVWEVAEDFYECPPAKRITVSLNPSDTKDDAQ